MQTFLGSLYCLAVVVLPYMHLMFDAHGAEATSSACSGHTHEPEHPPEDATPEAHHENCLLCKFLTVASDTPEPAPLLQIDHGRVAARSSADETYACILTRTYRARAPPSMTV